MTQTCQRCNKFFGTAEEQLRRFIDVETNISVQAPRSAVRGHRSATVAWRSGEGQHLAAFIRTAAPAFNTILESGSAEAKVVPLDQELVAAAWLKHAYLAACMHQQEVPDSSTVDRVRDVLLAARDRDRPALTANLQRLGSSCFGWADAPGAPPVLLYETGDAEVPWPFPDVPPRTAES